MTTKGGEMMTAQFNDSEQLFSFLWKHISDAAIVTDADGVVLRANDAYASLSGVSPESAVGQSVINLFPFELNKTTLEDYHREFTALENDAVVVVNANLNGKTAAFEKRVCFIEQDGVRIAMLSVIRRADAAECEERYRRLEHALHKSETEARLMLAEQKRIEKELRDAQEKESENKRLFQAIARYFPSGAINVFDRNYRLIFTDGEEYHAHGLNPAQFVGLSIQDIFPHKDLTKTKALYDKVFQGKAQSFEFEKQGFFYQNVVVPLPDDDGKIDRILGVVLNITERKKTEKARREQEEQLSAIAAAVPGVIYQYFIDPKLVSEAYAKGDIASVAKANGYSYISPRCKDLFGWSREELAEDMTRFAALFDPKEFPFIVNAVLEAAFEMKPFSLEFQVRKPDGETRWIQAQSVPTKDSNSERVTFNGVYLDITEKKAAEEKLRKNEEQLRALITVSPGVVYQWKLNLLTSEMEFLYVSPRAKDIFGLTGEKLTTDLMEAFMRLPAEDLQQLTNVIMQAVQARSKFLHEFQFTKPNGKKCWICAESIPLPNAETKADEIIYNGIFTDVTERKIIEQKLSEALKIANIGTVDINFHDQTLTYSDRHIEQLGTTLDRLGGRTFSFNDVATRTEFTLPEDSPTLAAQLAKAKAMKHGDKFINEPFEYRIRRADTGEVRTFYVFKVELFNDADGKATHATATIQDITERKKLEDELRDLNESLEKRVQERTEELRRSQQLYEAVARNFPNGMIGVYDTNFTLLFTEGTEFHRYGISPESLVGKTVDDIYSPEIAAQLKPHLVNAGQGVQTRFVLDFGAAQYEYIATPIHDAEGLVRQIMVVVQNVTEQRLAEARLKKSEALLAEAQDIAKIGSCEMDMTSGKITWSNHTFQLYERPKTLGEPTYQEYLERIHPADRDFVEQSNAHALQTGTPNNIEYRLLMDDGRVKHIRAIGSFAKNDNGNIVRVNHVIMDITAQKEAELEKQLLMEKVMQSQKLEAVGTLASGIAHEFNNIMAIVSLAAHALGEQLKRKDLLNHVATIQRTIERGAHIARQLLDFSRTDQVQKQPIDVQLLIEEIASTLRRLLPKKIHVETTVALQDIWINGSDKQLYQVLLNLGINAGDAMPDGGKLQFNLYTDTKRQPSNASTVETTFAVIEVADTGVGMPPEIQQRIFEPFFTTKGVGKGTGLGLSIVHGIVSAHDGFIELDSAVGKGTSFKLYIPLFNASAQKAKEAESKPVVAIGNAVILVVDDESYLRKMLSGMLRKQGYTVLEASDGEEALKTFETKSKKIDLVISDMGMPNMDGLQLFKKIRRRRKKMKGIIMTGYLDSKAAEQLEREGITVVSKPFDADKFAQTIFNILKNDSIKYNNW